MREEVYRVATRVGVPVFVVSNGSRPIRPPGLSNVQMVIVGAAAVVIVSLGLIYRRWLGGATGDCLGAATEVSETVMLVVAAGLA